MNRKSLLNVTYTDFDEALREPLEEIVQLFRKEYPQVCGEAYLGYPIYFNTLTGRKTCVDMALITKIGVFIFNILLDSVTNYAEIQDDIYIKVEEKFKRNTFLRSGRELFFEFHAITYSKCKITPVKDHLIAFSLKDVSNIINQYKRETEFTDRQYNQILSGIQEAYGLNARVVREGAIRGTKAYAVNLTNEQIEKYDPAQMEAILNDTKGIQRIRGMAGSGKTIVLARKAVELHMAHRDWTIVVTYSTRSLKNQLFNLINKFYSIKNDGEKIDTSKINIMQAWGSKSAPGVYYEVCKHHHLSPLNYTEAKVKFGKNHAFSKACELVMKEVPELDKMYDCILIDEAQDFDKNFMMLCMKILGEEKRLVYAYDELQKLNEETMPSPQEIFGEEIAYDTPLTVCYRNQSAVIVTAHAIGMGLYRKQHMPLQMPSSPDVWEAIGYKCDRKIEDGKPIDLYRTKETSPDLLNEDKDELIKFLSYESFNELKLELIKMLRNDLDQEHLLPSDIMIIDMDAIGSVNNRANIMNLVNVEDNYDGHLSIHLAGSSSPEDFARNDSVVYTSIFRAKGNESFMVYIINAQRCINSLVPRSDRNALFTAITRSKGWVRVMGYGEEMDSLCEEFEEIKKNDFKLHFDHYPTAAEREEMVLNNKDLDDLSMKDIQSTRGKIARVRAKGKVSDLQLMMEIMGVSTKEELLKLISEDKEE